MQAIYFVDLFIDAQRLTIVLRQYKINIKMNMKQTKNNKNTHFGTFQFMS